MTPKIFILPVVCLISLCTAGQYMMMKVEAEVQTYRPESTKSGYTDKTEVLGYEFMVKKDLDRSTGMAAGKRQYQPVTLWKVSGASSPQLFQSSATNERIKKLTLEFYRPDEVYKQMELSFSMEFENVNIVSYKQMMGVPEEGSFKAKGTGLYDEIQFTFEKVTFTDKKTRTLFNDNWSNVR